MRRSLFTLAAIAASAAVAAAGDGQSDVGATAASSSGRDAGPVAVTPARVASITDHHDAAITKLSESIIASRDDDDYVDSALDSLIEHWRMFEDVEMIAHQVHEQLLEGAYPRVARMLKSGEVDEEALKMVVAGRTALHQLMHQWHYALDSGWPSRTTDQQRVMLSALLQRGADPTAACAINTAARFRNHRAILEFLDAVNATHGPDTPGARRVTQCLANTDHGNIFHQAANSPSPAIARLFFRGGKNSVNGTDDSSFALATEAGVQFGSAHWPTVTKAALEDATRPIELDLLLPFLPSRAGIHTQLIDASTGKPASSASAGRPQLDFSKIDPENLDDEQFEALLNELDPGHEEAESPAMKSAMEGIVKLTQDLKQLDKELQEYKKENGIENNPETDTVAAAAEAALNEALASATSFLARKEKKNKIAHLDPGIDILHELLTQYDPMDQYTPALRACYSGRVDTLRHILRLLPVDATHDSVYMRGGRRANGATCAHLAAEQGYVGILKLLVERFGAESGVLNGINAAGRTPCEMAMKHGAVYAPAIRYLAHHGGCRPASAEPGSPAANEQKTRALDVATMCPAVRTFHGEVIRPILKRNSADSRYPGAPGYVYPPGVKVFGATAEHDDVRIHGIPNGPMDTFDPFAHVAAGWRMLSPDQLEAMHLPPDLLVPGARPAVEVDAAAAASTSSSDGNNNENPTVAVIKTLSKFQPLFQACAVDELPPSMLDLGENEMVMERDYLRQSRPFVVRGAYNPSILTQVPEHHPDATRVLEYSRLEGSRVMNQDRLFGIFGRLNVDTGALPYADAYGHSQDAKNMPVAEFVRRFMGHDIGSSEFEERQQDTVESLVESAWKHINATAAAHQHVAAAQAWVSAEVNAISGAATMSPPASTTEGSTPSSAAPGMVALTSLEDLEASILAAMHAAGAITDSNAKTARSIAKMITSGRAYKGPGSELTAPPYIFDGDVIDRKAGQIVGNFSLPRVFGKEGAHKQFIVGPARSGAMMHFHGAAVNVLFLGVKLWVLTPPPDASFVDSHVAKWWHDYYLPKHSASAGNSSSTTGSASASASSNSNTSSTAATGIAVPPARHTDAMLMAHPELDTIGEGGIGRWHYVGLQGPGDLMYVPHHWGHAVFNLADSVALAYE